MSNPTHPTSTTPETGQIQPQGYACAFYAPRNEGAPYPPYSLRAAEELIFKAEHVPPELAAFSEDFIGCIYLAWEHTDAARTLAGLLFRELEAEGSKSLGLARALCLALAEASYGVGKLDETARVSILKALGQEVR